MRAAGSAHRFGLDALASSAAATLALLALLASLSAPASARGQAAPATDGGEATDLRPDSLVTPTSGTLGHYRDAPRTSARLLTGEIELDGVLDEAIWEQAPPVTRFIQREPNEGEPATQSTEVRFAYDGETLYVGARMYDELGAEGVVSRLVRRDTEAQSDELTIIFDTFHDHLGQTRFSINPAGVRGDAFGPGGSHPDQSWDPVWRASTRIDSLGWTAELAIPFSQLRFPRHEEMEWGLQLQRTVKRLNEVSVWSFWRLNESGGPSRYGHLQGLGRPQTGTNRLELLPYAVSQLDVSGNVDPDNPLRGTVEPTYRFGADLKYLITSNLTLNATINPDFGQAEVDPAVVNLSAFETFFPEKREFFIEGRGVFDFGGLWCYFCSNVSSLNMLFTRRIGRAPQASHLASTPGGYADVPPATTILGAAKVTGRTGGGTSVGLLGALTSREKAAAVTADGESFAQEVEPLSGYFVGRVKQDMLDGDLQIGGILSSVVRDFDDPALSQTLNRHAEGLGVDGEYWWGDRTYHLLWSGAVSNISGTPEAILGAQRSSARYFQRPDRGNGGNGLFTNAYDSTLTSMRGYGWYTRLAKDAGDWRWEGSLNLRSPGFENNDYAFLTRADYILMGGNLLRSFTTPTSWYRRLTLIGGGQQQFNYDGDRTNRQLNAFFSIETPFYWDMTAFGIYRFAAIDDRLTRGGPAVETPASAFLFTGIQTDDRKPVIAGFEPTYGWDTDGGWHWTLPLGITIKPRSNVLLSLHPTLSRRKNADQYVTSVDDPVADHFYGHRYVFSDLQQTSLSMTTRLNVTFTPTMSLELFVQPLISSNEFTRFKEFDRPRGLAKSVYGADVGTIRSEGAGDSKVYFVDPDGDGPSEEFSFPNQDFTLRSLRGNLVYRWEYTPGSTLFLVWTRAQSTQEPFGDFSFGRHTGALLDGASDNVFLVKVSYWLGL